MNVLFVSNDPSVFDAASAARARMRAYAAALAEVSEKGQGSLHILSVGGKGAREEIDGALHLHPVRVSKLLRVHALSKCARKLIREKGIDVVSAQDPFEHGLAALRAVRGTGAKLHIQIHTDFLSPWFLRSGNPRAPRVRVPFKNYLRRRIAAHVLQRADGIRAVSERIRHSLSATYGSAVKESSVIPVPVNAQVPLLVPLPPHAFTFALIAVGRLEREKRVEDIFAALARVVPKYPMVGLFVVGDGRARGKLERMARKLGLSKQVIFLGNRPDARGLMGSAQAFIQASAYEGYGRTLLEAALAKVPIITTDVGIVGEVFTGYEDILSAPVADPTALAYHIVGLIEDMTVRVALPISAEAKARAHLADVGDIPARIAEDLARLHTSS